MPSKNIIKNFGEKQYYHIYNRGVNKECIFKDDIDKDYFLSLLDRHLNPENKLVDKRNVEYKKYHENIELLSYCLMDNHYHFLFWIEKDKDSITKFMRSIGTAYTMYFNLKYKRVGPLFQSNYKASRIDNDMYLYFISRYIHENPSDYKNYIYSSYSAHKAGGYSTVPWLKPDRIIALSDFERLDLSKSI